MENHDGMVFAGKISDSSTRALWKYYQHRHLIAKQEDLGEEN
jgi:hypothetical protein